MNHTAHIRAALLASLLCFVFVHPLQAQHRHLNAGATTRTVGSKLFFANGGAFNTASRSLVQLKPVVHHLYGPLFQGGDDLTCAGLPATPDLGGPDPASALAGTRIAMRVVSVSGPAGGSISFWNSDGDYIADEITFTVPVGASATNDFILSENDGSAGADPYGHIHGRRWSADRAGLYVVGFQLIDTSTNGPGGGPMHTPSDAFFMYFQAGTTIGAFEYSIAGNTVKFGTEIGKTYTVEASPGLGAAADWKPAAGPIAGTAKLETVGGLSSVESPKFYRLRIQQP